MVSRLREGSAKLSFWQPFLLWGQQKRLPESAHRWFNL
jgi:hypothetical protein